MRYILFLIFLLFSICSKCQYSKFSFETGLRLRVTPIYISGVSGIIINPDPPVLIQQDPHLSGMSVFSGLKYNLTNSLAISYRIYIRYDQFITEQSASGNTSLKKQFFVDHSVILQKGFLKNKQLSFKAGVGITFNNLNSGFSYKRSFIDPFGNPSFTVNTGNFNFTSLDLPLSYNFKNLFVGLTPSLTINEKFAENSELLLISISAGFSLPIKKKEKN